MNAFQYKNLPSVFAGERKTAQVINLEPKGFHVYSKAGTPADRAIDAEMAQNNKEMEAHMKMAGIHRSEARKLAARNAALINKKSLEYWAAVQAERGLG